MQICKTLISNVRRILDSLAAGIPNGKGFHNPGHHIEAARQPLPMGPLSTGHPKMIPLAYLVGHSLGAGEDVTFLRVQAGQRRLVYSPHSACRAIASATAGELCERHQQNRFHVE